MVAMVRSATSGGELVVVEGVAQWLASSDSGVGEPC